MSGRIEVSAIEIRRANEAERDRGVVAFVAATIDGRWRVDGLSIRRGSKCAYVLLFPARVDGVGRRRAFVRPLDGETRRAVEDAVLEELLRRQGEPRAMNQGATAEVAGAQERVKSRAEEPQ